MPKSRSNILNNSTVFPAGFDAKRDNPDLEFTAEPETLEEFAEEYLRLQKQMAPLKKRMADMRKEVLARTQEGDTELANGIIIKRCVHAAKNFMVKLFEKEHNTLYEEYLEDITKERVEIKYRTT